MAKDTIGVINEDEVKLKGLQEMLQRQRVAERERLKQEKAEYEKTNSQIKSLISSLIECENNLLQTYEKISLGISCGDSTVTSGIENIKNYKDKLTNNRIILQEVSREIDTEISKLNDQINTLNSQIYWGWSV